MRIDQTNHPIGVTTALRSDVAGAVLTEGDPGYDRARTPHFANKEGRPVAVVRPRDAADVAATIRRARASGVPLFVRGGGHHPAGHSTGDGLLLDLGSLTGLVVNPDDGTAWAQGGLTAGEVTAALAPHGVAVGFGDTGSVGIGGLTLGGGVGFLSRLHGMTIDHLLAAEIVTADGQVRMVDADHEPALFWALRGGGGNFGVVTGFRYRLAPVSTIYGGTLLLPATPDALAGLLEACAEARDELTVIVMVMALPPLPGLPPSLHGQVAIMARVCWAGPPEQGPEAVRPLRAVATPIADLLDAAPYASLFETPAASGGQQVTGHTMYVNHVDHVLAATVLDRLHQTDAPVRMVQFRVLGGAIARVDPLATAYAHRRSRIMVTIARSVGDDLDEAREWTESLADSLRQDDPGAFVNFFGTHDGDRIPNAYPPPTLARLREVKRAYDPGNLFRANVNIVPRAG